MGAKLKVELTSDGLRAELTYDPETGHFTRACWRQGRGGHAGTINNLGYRLIRVGGWRYRAHRLAWLYVHGAWPAGQIDHINGIRDDNRIANLRDVPDIINQQNRRNPHKGSQVPFLGVKLAKQPNRFVAGIKDAGRHVHLGVFDSPEEAHAAYLDAKRELHEGCTL